MKEEDYVSCFCWDWWDLFTVVICVVTKIQFNNNEDQACIIIHILMDLGEETIVITFIAIALIILIIQDIVVVLVVVVVVPVMDLLEFMVEEEIAIVEEEIVIVEEEIVKEMELG